MESSLPAAQSPKSPSSPSTTTSSTESIRGHKISDMCHESSTTTKIASVHEILIHWIDEIPSVQQSSHYGNISYRTWHEWIGISRSVHAFFLFLVIWRSRLCCLDAETKAKEEYSQKLQELQAEVASCNESREKLQRKVSNKRQRIYLGWRIGWAIAPAFAASAIRNIHVKLTDSAPAPFQEAALTALTSPPEYFERLKKEYEFKRDFIVKVLTLVGFQIHFKPQGSIFLFAELPRNCLLSDVEYVKELIKEAGVVAVPGCGFFHTKLSMEPSSEASCNYQKRYVRFAFCKSIATLAAAAQKFSDLKNATRYEQP
ncbi:hypothetical protein SLEP1_g1412 [Rubroshorea leprosula]|uniref:Aminotransferase class I/classII large domain-containing protein n=1 Tax=Rubroshorea leprosula TaxID=152421 RepID=A0AAV5HDP7_9ROSI|nr:hypothetical protein SLEP1_g1412 [Rubroshorea leprosula]